RPNSQGRETSRHAHHPTDQVRAGPKLADGADDRHCRPTQPSSAGRRGDRMMRRREFITLLGGGAAWPLAARAQQSAMPVVWVLRSTSRADASRLTTAFGQGLREAGFIVGQNVELEYRSAENRADRLPVLVADLVRRQVVLIVGNTVAKAVT